MDSLTQFTGYENQVKNEKFNIVIQKNYQNKFPQDWFVPSPALQIPPGGFGLNKDQIRETLNYFRE